MEICGNKTGAFVAGGATFKKCPIPGRKKSSGDTVAPVLMPLQPAANNANTASIASRSNFQFNLTSRL